MEFLVFVIVVVIVYFFKLTYIDRYTIDMVKANIQTLSHINREMLKSYKLESMPPVLFDYMEKKIDQYSANLPSLQFSENKNNRNIYRYLKDKYNKRRIADRLLKNLYSRLKNGIDLTILLSHIAQSSSFGTPHKLIDDYKTIIEDIKKEKDDIFATQYERTRQPYILNNINCSLYEFMRDSPAEVTGIIEFSKSHCGYENPFIISISGDGPEQKLKYSQLQDKRSHYLNHLLVKMCEEICQS